LSASALLFLTEDGRREKKRAKGEANVVRYRRVLIVEDEEPLRRLIRRNLTARGSDVSEAATAVEGIEAAISGRPDLILLDLNLPDRSGWDVLRALRIPAEAISA
jgi:DNA-binding response OmpR family regulator